MTLARYAKNENSYAGEDGLISELCQRLNLRAGFCVEFGAADGIECSNTAALRRRDWSALLIEADPKLFARLSSLESDSVKCLNRRVSLTGDDSIDCLLKDSPRPNLMSIDVDGDDYFIFESMEVKPEVVIIEYNQSVPWFLDIRASEPGNKFGASALSLYRLAQHKGYEIAGATETNLLLVLADKHEDGFGSYEEVMSELPLRCGFIFTDYACRQYAANFGNLPQWGWRSSDPLDVVVHGAPFYPGDSPAISDRFKQERV